MSEPSEQNDLDAATVLTGVALLLGLIITSWLIATAACLIGSGELCGLSVLDAVTSALRLVANDHWTTPRDAYPRVASSRMPNAVIWWTSTGLVLTASVAAVTWAFRRYEPETARARLARRPGDLRGSRPRAWARPRDVRDCSPGGFLVGRLDRHEIRTHEEAHVALIAPTRAGKTTRYVIPWLLEHDGPAIVTSTKRDILDATSHHRRDQGNVWVFDPFSDDSCSWDSLAGCEDWSGALRQAQWLADATQQGDSELAGYWRGEAAKLLAPLLHAAALEQRSIATILEWVDKQNPQDASRWLLAHKTADSTAAERQLQAVRGLDDRNRGTTFMSAGSVLAAYRYPKVLEHAASADLTADALLDGANTLYVVSSERHQRLLEPILVALLSSLLHAALERGRDARRLRVLLDEAANIAPLQDLPRLMSQAAGHGIRIATVWQSLAQMDERYGSGMHTILANSAAKLVMGSTTDEMTRQYLNGLLDEDADDLAQALQRLQTGRALYLNPSSPPAVVNVAAHRGL